MSSLHNTVFDGISHESRPEQYRSVRRGGNAQLFHKCLMFDFNPSSQSSPFIKWRGRHAVTVATARVATHAFLSSSIEEKTKVRSRRQISHRRRYRHRARFAPARR